MNLSSAFVTLYIIFVSQVNCYKFWWFESAVNFIKCPVGDCCNDQYIPQNITGLRQELKNNLFGQHIAQEEIVAALAAHIAVEKPSKALSMVFLGTAGTGKNFVAKMITNNFYAKGSESQHFQVYTGRIEFSLLEELNKYKAELVERIVEGLLKCPRSLFLFDEVDLMIPGLLDILVPFLDHGPVQIPFKGTKQSVSTNKAIFIFLSNTGSHEIAKTLVELRAQGKSRSETTLRDFENLVTVGAFNQQGGLHKSHTISNSLIDHYIPFLPLEKEHIRQCIVAEYKLRKFEPTEELIEEAMSHTTFGEHPFDLYVKNGCKRVEQKVGSIISKLTIKAQEKSKSSEEL